VGKVSSDKNTRDLIAHVLRLNPGAMVYGGGKTHIKVQAPGLPLVVMSASPSKDHRRTMKANFRRAGYKL
jgi:hypothetical protein